MIDSIGKATASLTVTQVLGLTLWAEARGEPRDGILAVACVIRNRAKNPGWWGKSLRSVCLKPQQFSCWNPGTDPNHVRLMDLVRRLTASQPVDLPKLDTCLAIAGDIVDDIAPDPTQGCDHYFNPDAMVPKGSCPRWAQDPVTKLALPPVVVIGSHWFYKLGLKGKA